MNKNLLRLPGNVGITVGYHPQMIQMSHRKRQNRNSSRIIATEVLLQSGNAIIQISLIVIIIIVLIVYSNSLTSNASNLENETKELNQMAANQLKTCKMALKMCRDREQFTLINGV